MTPCARLGSRKLAPRRNYLRDSSLLLTADELDERYTVDVLDCESLRSTIELAVEVIASPALANGWLR